MREDIVMIKDQKRICRKYNADFMEVKKDDKLGIAFNIKKCII